MGNERVFVEELDSVDGVFVFFTVTGGEGVEEVQL